MWLTPLTSPEGPARHLDVSGQKLSPHCLETIFDSQLPSPKLSPKMPPKLSLPTGEEGIFASFEITLAVRVIARQLRDKNCLGAIFAPGHHQGAAKGVRQKEFDHFFRFRDAFGHFSVTFSDASVTFFRHFLPNSFCRTPFASG